MRSENGKFLVAFSENSLLYKTMFIKKVKFI